MMFSVPGFHCHWGIYTYVPGFSFPLTLAPEVLDAVSCLLVSEASYIYGGWLYLQSISESGLSL